MFNEEAFLVNCRQTHSQTDDGLTNAHNVEILIQTVLLCREQEYWFVQLLNSTLYYIMAIQYKIWYMYMTD